MSEQQDPKTVILPEFVDTGEETGEVIIKMPKGSFALFISPTIDREGYGINLLGNNDPSLPITLAQSMYGLMSGCVEAIKYKKESLLKLAIIAHRKEQQQKIDPDDVIWNRDTPKHYLERSRAKGNA